MSFRFLPKLQRGPSRMIPVMVVSVVFGLAAGIVGMLFANAYASPAQVYGSVYSVQSGHTAHPVDAIVRLPVSVATASRAAVSFVPKVTRHGRINDRSILPTDAVASGMVLTSDGWIITHASAFDGDPAKAADGLEAVIGARRYPIQKVVTDQFSGVVFLKVDGANLPVTVFDNGGSVQAGETAYSFDAAGGSRRVEVISYDDVPVSDTADLIRSSERMQKALRISRPDPEVLPGSMVVNASGQVIGVYAGDAAIGAYAVPYAAFEGQIGTVLKDGRSIRPYLGVHYLDLASLVGVRDSTERQRGALLVNGETNTVDIAVMKHSPAETAGLKEGDLVLSVNGEDLTPNKDLADLIAEYPPGTIVTLTVRPGYTEAMNGPDLTVDIKVTLGSI